MSTFSQDPGVDPRCHWRRGGLHLDVNLVKRAKEQKQSSLDSHPITGNRSSGGRGVNVRSHHVAQTQTQQSCDRVHFHPPA